MDCPFCSYGFNYSSPGNGFASGRKTGTFRRIGKRYGSQSPFRGIYPAALEPSVKEFPSSGLCTTFFGTIFGALLANLRIKWEFKAGKLLDIAAWILMIMPSFIIAQGWVYFASGNGVARAWLGWDGISSLVFSFPGLVFIMVLNKFPFAYVTIKSALEWKPKRLSYAARVNGPLPGRNGKLSRLRSAFRPIVRRRS